MLVDSIKKLIRQQALIWQGDHVVLGFSGGPDSLCLFDVLCGLQEELGFTLSCVHVNHGLRPGAAEEDQKFVEEICAQRGVACEVVSVDCRAAARSLGLTEEEAGRRLRYDAFAKRAAALAQQGAARVVIAVAQNRNDQAETVLQRLLRGTGTDGLAGMDYRRSEAGGFDIIRPLLDTGRADIEAYLSARGLTPRRDHTNEENDYVRNRIRNELIPYLAEHFNPNIVETLTRAAANAREDSAYLRQLADERLFDAQTEAGEIPLPMGGPAAFPNAAERPDRVILDRQTVLAAPLPVRHRMLRMAFAHIGLLQDIAAVHLAAMDKLIEEGRTSSRTVLPGGYVLRIGYDTAECLTPGGAKGSSEDKTAADGGKSSEVYLAAVLTREELLETIREEAAELAAAGRQTGLADDETLSDAERIRAYIYSKNFIGINEASCILDADRVAILLTMDRRTASADSGIPAGSVTAEMLPELIEFRTRRAGDRLPLKAGNKSIQDLMVDEKIPRDRRNQIPLAAAGSTVLWIAGGMPRPRYAAGCAAGPETERFLLLEMTMYV